MSHQEYPIIKYKVGGKYSSNSRDAERKQTYHTHGLRPPKVISKRLGYSFIQCSKELRSLAECKTALKSPLGGGGGGGGGGSYRVLQNGMLWLAGNKTQPVV